MSGIHKLSERQLRAAKPGTVMTDGGGLYLQTAKGGNSSWIFRKMIEGRMSVVGLGAYPATSIEAAREAAGKIRAHVSAGGAPEDFKDRNAILKTTTGAPRFIEYAEIWMKKHLAKKSPKTVASWRNVIRTHGAPLHHLPIDKITLQMVGNKALAPIWLTHPETAKRLQTRLWRIFASARVEGLIVTNPADWAGALDLYMPKQDHTVEHLRAMPIEDVPDLYMTLEELPTIGSRCLQALILTGLRVGEARRLRWEWINTETMTLTIPAAIMKISDNGDHRIPITPELMRLFDKVRRAQGIMIDVAELGAAARRKPTSFRPIFFTKNSRGAAEPNVSETAVRVALEKAGFDDQTTIHGLRTPFRVWLQTKGGLQYEACEAALHHRIRDTTVRAYLRTDWLEERRPAMAAWADFVSARVKKPRKAAPVEAGEAEVELSVAY